MSIFSSLFYYHCIIIQMSNGVGMYNLVLLLELHGIVWVAELSKCLWLTIKIKKYFRY